MNAIHPKVHGFDIRRTFFGKPQCVLSAGLALRKHWRVGLLYLPALLACGSPSADTSSIGRGRLPTWWAMYAHVPTSMLAW